jgi:argininosuccinate lyase
MPQKRNPFLLEHVLGRTSAEISAFVQSVTAMHAAPFTNSIAVGTEAVKPVWGALENLTGTIRLLGLILRHAEPDREAMLARASRGFTTATELANYLTSNADMDFRSAHRTIGEAVTSAMEKGSQIVEEVAGECVRRGITVPVEKFSPPAVVQSLEFGGGPGPASLKRCVEQLVSTWREHLRRMRTLRRSWQDAAHKLQDAVDIFCSPGKFPGPPQSKLQQPRLSPVETCRRAPQCKAVTEK